MGDALREFLTPAAVGGTIIGSLAAALIFWWGGRSSKD